MAEATARSLKVVVVTPEKAVLDEAADMVILPMIDGELGVQPGRAPLIGRLGAGELRLNVGPSTKRFFVEAGFVQVRANVVTVLTASAKPSAAVTPDVVAAALSEAAALPGGNPVERASKARARDRAAGLQKVAAKNTPA
jgi:F-type H+-transporting ATPase subunit epsilon